MRVFLATGALALVMTSSPALGRGDGRHAQVAPEIRQWMEGLTDAQGRGCCATADGFQPDEVEWDTRENHYRVRIAGAWLVVPDGAVIHEPNRLGYAVVWYFVDNGRVVIRCFLPGSGS